MRTVSIPAQRLHAAATLRSVEGSPGFIPDDDLPADVETDLATAELCLAGIWARVTGGYLVKDIALLRHVLEVHEQMGRAPDF